MVLDALDQVWWVWWCWGGMFSSCPLYLANSGPNNSTTRTDEPQTIVRPLSGIPKDAVKQTAQKFAERDGVNWDLTGHPAKSK